MWDRFDRWVPLTGIVFVVLVLIGGPVLGGTTPDGTASPHDIISFYTQHQGSERASVYFLGLAFVAYLFFAAVLRSRWRRVPGTEGLATVVLVAAAIEVVGQCAGAGAVFALTTAPSSLGPDSAQALNLVANSLLVISAVGNFAFCLVAGLMILRGRGVVPAWLGWVVIVICPLFLLPGIEFVGFLVFIVWVVVMSILLLRSRGNETDSRTIESTAVPVS